MKRAYVRRQKIPTPAEFENSMRVWLKKEGYMERTMLTSNEAIALTENMYEYSALKVESYDSRLDEAGPDSEPISAHATFPFEFLTTIPSMSEARAYAEKLGFRPAGQWTNRNTKNVVTLLFRLGTFLRQPSNEMYTMPECCGLRASLSVGVPPLRALSAFAAAYPTIVANLAEENELPDINFANLIEISVPRRPRLVIDRNTRILSRHNRTAILFALPAGKHSKFFL